MSSNGTVDHGMTSFACGRGDGGIVRPSARAIDLRLTVTVRAGMVKENGVESMIAHAVSELPGR